MTTQDTVLASLSEWRPAGDGPHELGIPLDGPTLRVTAERGDELSVLCRSIALDKGDSSPATAADLTGWAVALAGRVTGLLEPLKVWEVDAVEQVALLRSSTPAVRGESRLYYELRLDGKRLATLRRFRASTQNGSREAIPFPLTHEAVAKLAGDLV